MAKKVQNYYANRLLVTIEQHALKNVDNSLNTSIYSYLETSGGKSSNLYSDVDHFFNARVN